MALPAPVLAAVAGRDDAVVARCEAEPITGGTGAATAAVTRLRVWFEGEEAPIRLVRKDFMPLSTGRHAEAAADPRHWAYWRRELLAYESGAVPAGPGLAAPHSYGTTDQSLYLQDVSGEVEEPRVAARRLGTWEAGAAIPDVPWLAGHQLAQRIAVSDLDWSKVESPLASVWPRRHEILADLRAVPTVLSHGDFHAVHLIAGGDTTVVLDWGTLGLSPAGADLAHLALSTLDDLFDDYMAGAGSRLDPAAVRLGYRSTLALTAASRVHWMRSRGVPVPAGYEEFVLADTWFRR